MAAPFVETQQRVPMSWDDYLALPDDMRHEYFDGCLVMSPFPDLDHQRVVQRLSLLLADALPGGYEALAGAPWRPTVGQEFGPDVAVFDAVAGQKHLVKPPVLAVEVLSTDRRYDLVLKAAKYAAAGLPRYWVVDRRDRRLLVMERRNSVFETVQTLTADSPAEVDFGIASVRIDLGELLAS